MEESCPSIPRQLEGKARETYVLDFLIDEQLVVQKAQASSPRRLQEARPRQGADGDAAGDVAQKSATEAAIKQTYDEAAKNQKPETRISRASHSGADRRRGEGRAEAHQGRRGFRKVATEMSKDPGLAKAGDLGWFTTDRMVPEFGAAAAEDRPRVRFSEPVRRRCRLAHHQARREAPEGVSAARPSQRPGRPLRGPEGESELVMKLREGSKIERSDAPRGVPAPSGGRRQARRSAEEEGSPRRSWRSFSKRARYGAPLYL